ncbi:MAG TPA: WG repeat-containing protein, partial [Urbifossiella sp.]|nr:WG repeat-containing protein [Urbifossiella sp.]
QKLLFAAITVGVMLAFVWAVSGDRDPGVGPPPESAVTLPQEFVATATPATQPGPADPPPEVGFSFLDFAYVNSKWGFIDRTGKVVVQARYSRVDEFSDGLAPVKVGGTYAAGGKWGYIDRTGKEVISPRFDGVWPFREGFAAVEIGDKYGFIDRTGAVVIPPRFTSLHRFSEGLAAVQEDGAWGFIGPDGEYRIRPRFGWAGDFSEGLAAVHDRPAVGMKDGDQPPMKYIDRTGAVVIELPPDIDIAYSFHEERAVVLRGRLYGLIDRTGRVIVEPRYDAFESFRGGRARVSLRRSVKVGGFVRSAGTKSGYVAADGTELGPFLPDYDDVPEIDPATGALTAVVHDDLELKETRVSAIDFGRLRSQEGLYQVVARRRPGHPSGFVDRQGKVVIPPTLERVGEFREGLAPFATGLDWKAVEAARRRRP